MHRRSIRPMSLSCGVYNAHYVTFRIRHDCYIGTCREDHKMGKARVGRRRDRDAFKWFQVSRLAGCRLKGAIRTREVEFTRSKRQPSSWLHLADASPVSPTPRLSVSPILGLPDTPTPHSPGMPGSVMSRTSRYASSSSSESRPISFTTARTGFRSLAAFLATSDALS